MVTKSVQGYEGYLINNKGEVFSSKRENRVKKLKEDISPLGYRRVTLSKDGNTKRFLVHRLVLTHFDRLPKEGEVCRHLNGDPNDNRIENLTWGSNHENCEDARDHGTGAMKITWEDVDHVRYWYSKGLCNTDISNKTGVSSGAICHIVSGSSWQEKHRRKPFTRAYEYDMRPEWVDGEKVSLSRHRNRNFKANFEIAEEIREMKRNGVRSVEISEKTGLSLAIVNNIVANRTWKK